MCNQTVTRMLGACTAVLVAQAAWSQAPTQGGWSPAPTTQESGTVVYAGSVPAVMPLGGTIDMISGHGIVPGEVVPGKPYSAESVTETVQILADGNRITSTNRARLYRDGEGRTRLEQTLGAVGSWQASGMEPFTMITINDPVAGLSYSLDPRSRTGRQVSPARLEGRLLAMLESRAGDGAHDQVSAARIEAGRAVFSAPSLSAVAAPGMRLRMLLPGASGEWPAPVTEDLGEQVLEGVMTRGTRGTQVIPAGAIGNERPIEIVTEQWYSAELEALVLRSTVDPRFGETRYRLTGVVLGEPPPELFEVPAGYEIEVVEPPSLHLAPDGEPAREGFGRRVILRSEPDAER